MIGDLHQIKNDNQKQIATYSKLDKDGNPVGPQINIHYFTDEQVKKLQQVSADLHAFDDRKRKLEEILKDDEPVQLPVKNNFFKKLFSKLFSF